MECSVHASYWPLVLAGCYRSWLWPGSTPCGCWGSSVRSDEQIRRRYLAENHVLNDIRSDVYVSGTYVRDYLLEPEPRRAEATAPIWNRFASIWRLRSDSYGRQMAPADIEHYTALRRELADYWDILAPIFQWDAAERRRSGILVSARRSFPAAAEHAGARGSHRQPERTTVGCREPARWCRCCSASRPVCC